MRANSTWWKAGVVAALLTAIVYGEPITIFRDDFTGDTPGSDPGPPPVGQPWQITKAASDGVQVAVDPLSSQNQVLAFGRYRNTATLPLSPTDQETIQQARAVTLAFQYLAAPASGPTGFFDIGGYAGSAPTFFLRVQPDEIPGVPGMHSVSYLKPGGGLADTGLDLSATAAQSVEVASDFVNRLLPCRLSFRTSNLNHCGLFDFRTWAMGTNGG